MCVSEAKYCVDYCATSTLTESDERRLICDLRDLSVRASKCLGICVCVLLYAYICELYCGVNEKQNSLKVCVCVCEYELSSPVSDHRLKERKHRGEYLFQTGGNSSLLRQIQDETTPERIPQIKTFPKIH